jgi:hypothetical protein
MEVTRLTNEEKNPAGKFKRLKDGTWKSSNNRWRIVRSATRRYDLHDLNRAKDDTLYMMGLPTVAACEEGARGVEWADRMEKDPSGKKPEE